MLVYKLEAIHLCGLLFWGPTLYLHYRVDRQIVASICIVMFVYMLEAIT